MKKVLLLSLLMLTTALSTTWAQPSLSGCRHITDVSQIEEGHYYYIVSDRTKFNVVVTTPKAIAAWQDGFPNWDNASQNKYFVYWGDLTLGADNFIWKAEKVSDQWAFQNMSNDKYLGVMHKHHPTYPHSSETDMVFSDDAKGFTLSDLSAGEGRWAFTNSEWTSPFTPQRYASNSSYNIALRNGDNDSDATDTESYGYPSRWHLYELTSASSTLEDGKEFYIISDVKPEYHVENTGREKAISTLQGENIHFPGRRWGESYVYWGDFAPEYDGYVWVAEKNGDKWAFKNTKNNKYIGSENEPEFSETPVYFYLSDLSVNAGRFFVQYVDSEKGLNLQRWTQARSGCLNITTVTGCEGNDNQGYGNRWRFISVEDYMQQVAEDNAGTNTITEIYASGNGGTNIMGPTGNVANLVLSDGAEFAPSKSFTAASATYERDMANEWGTICLPYEVESNAEVEYYTISGIENDVLQVTKLNTLPAGTPALVRKVSGTSITATNSNVSVLTAPGAGTSSAVEMCGTFAQGVEVTDANAYYIKNNKFWQCNNKFYCDAFRAYFKITGSSSPSFSININDDDVTGVSSATDDKDATVVAVYSADGTKRSTLQQGINIVKLSNGKVQKIVVR